MYNSLVSYFDKHNIPTLNLINYMPGCNQINSLNLLKTHYNIMVFHRPKHKNMDVKLCINKVLNQQVDNTTYLGVIIDDYSNWSNHISYNNSKIAKGIGIICRANKFVSKSALVNLYYAFIFPYLIYCVEVWGYALTTHTQPLITFKNKNNQDYYKFSFLGLF